MDAYVVLRRCPDGAEGLAAAWRKPPSDPETLDRLAFSSTLLSDSRVLSAALSVVQDRSAPLPLRRAAMDAVVGEFAPGYHIRPATWLQPEVAHLARYADLTQRQGEHPVTEAERATVRTALARMGSDASEKDWQRIVARIMEDLPESGPAYASPAWHAAERRRNPCGDGALADFADQFFERLFDSRGGPIPGLRQQSPTAPRGVVRDAAVCRALQDAVGNVLRERGDPMTERTELDYFILGEYYGIVVYEPAVNPTVIVHDSLTPMFLFSMPRDTRKPVYLAEIGV